MIIAGVLVGGVVVLAHGNHSDYDDYDDYSKYSDSGMIRQVNEANAKKENAKRSLKEAEEALNEEYQNGMDELEEKYGDISTNSKNARDFLREKDQLLRTMKTKMEKEVDDAQKEVDDINAAIQKINTMQLKK